jgi:hypothetical protein
MHYVWKIEISFSIYLSLSRINANITHKNIGSTEGIHSGFGPKASNGKYFNGMKRRYMNNNISSLGICEHRTVSVSSRRGRLDCRVNDQDPDRQINDESTMSQWWVNDESMMSQWWVNDPSLEKQVKSESTTLRLIHILKMSQWSVFWLSTVDSKECNGLLFQQSMQVKWEPSW